MGVNFVFPFIAWSGCDVISHWLHHLNHGNLWPWSNGAQVTLPVSHVSSGHRCLPLLVFWPMIGQFSSLLPSHWMVLTWIYWWWHTSGHQAGVKPKIPTKTVSNNKYWEYHIDYVINKLVIHAKVKWKQLLQCKQIYFWSYC